MIEHPVDVRLATTGAERRLNTPPLGADLLKKARSCPVACCGVFDSVVIVVIVV